MEVGDGDHVIAAEVRGELREGAESLPLVSGNRVVGRLAWAPQRVEEPLGPGERRLLEDIAGQLAVAVYALMQTSELQRAKERLVTERETERARWRDAHHDRVKPALSGIVCQLEAIRNNCRALEGRPGMELAAVKEQVEVVKTDVWSVKADLDRLGDDRCPRRLDELGLVDAVRHHAASFGLPPSPLVVSVDAPEALVGLPTDVEVASFLIVCEALENVRKHADARRCRIVLSIDGDQLSIEVSDDGRGLPPDFETGVGIPSMRKRAVDLDGELEIASVPERGTQVLARFPMAP